MKYNLKQAVWEITYLCNMRCVHCGSSCGIPLEDELTTGEALKLCDDLGGLKLRIVTLSGGEPFLRQDWPILARRLSDNGVKVNCISNGWYIDQTLIEEAKRSGIVNIGVSIDGLKDTHDFFRMKGSFDRSLAALELMKNNDMPTVACTTVHKKNLKELPLLKQFLIEKGVERWQFQIGRPMGNLLSHPELILDPEEIEEIVNYCHSIMKEGSITVDIADCIGYYSVKDVELRQQSDGYSDGVWRGCSAGKHVIGIRANGDITGCLSIRNDKYIEGNVRESPLAELWTRPDAFAWNRELTKDALTNFCATCQYGSICMGGCSGTKITMHDCTTYNDHCLFKVTVDRMTGEVKNTGDVGLLIARSRQFIASENYQFANIYLHRALEVQPDNLEVMELLGFVNYFMTNYDASIDFNKKILNVNSKNSYALKGYGLCMEKLGRLDEGIKYLKRSIKSAPKGFYDPYYDLAVVLDCHNRCDEAIKVLDSGRAISDEFKKRSEKLYQQIGSKTKKGEII